MKIIILLLLLSLNIYPQSWIEEWQKAIVSIGVIDSLQYKSQNQIHFKKYFRVVGTGVLFYIKIDTLSVHALVTAKHVFTHRKKIGTPNLLTSDLLLMTLDL
jgi:hypothetical protein